MPEPPPTTGSSHAQLIIVRDDGHLDLRPPTMRTLGAIAQRAQTDHALTHRGHTPLGAAHATAYVHARDLTATATTRRCNAGSASGRSGSPASSSSRSRASSAATRRRPRCTGTWGAPTHGSSGPTTARRCKRQPATSRLGTRLYGCPRGAPGGPHGRKLSALGWCPRLQRRSSAP